METRQTAISQYVQLSICALLPISPLLVSVFACKLIEPKPIAPPAPTPTKRTADVMAGVENVYSLDGVMFVEWTSSNLYAPSTVDVLVVQNNQTVFVIESNVENTGSYAFYLTSARSVLAAIAVGVIPTDANRNALQPFEYRILIRSVQKPSVRATSGMCVSLFLLHNLTGSGVFCIPKIQDGFTWLIIPRFGLRNRLLLRKAVSNTKRGL